MRILAILSRFGLTRRHDLCVMFGLKTAWRLATIGDKSRFRKFIDAIQAVAQQNAIRRWVKWFQISLGVGRIEVPSVRVGVLFMLVPLSLFELGEAVVGGWFVDGRIHFQRIESLFGGVVFPLHGPIALAQNPLIVIFVVLRHHVQVFVGAGGVTWKDATSSVSIFVLVVTPTTNVYRVISGILIEDIIHSAQISFLSRKAPRNILSRVSHPPIVK